MSPEKFIKYSVPFFVLAIISRSIEEISFFYYAVPVFCLFYFLFYVRHIKSQRSKVKGQNYKVDSETPFSQSPESDGTRDSDSSQAGMTDSEPVNTPFRRGKQVGMTDNSASSFWSDLSRDLVKNGRSPESGKPADADSEQGGMTDNSASGTLTSKVTPLLFLLPGIWFLVTSLWSSYPEVSATRALYFILISTGCISAGVLWIRYSGRNIFELLLPANVIVVLICLFSLITNIPSDSWTAGHGKGFIGFFGHQNLLASVLLFTLPSVFHRVVILVRLQSRPRQGRAKSRIRNVESSDSRSTLAADRRTSFAGMTLKSDSSFRRSPESESTSNYLPLTAYSLLLTANLILLTLTYSRSAILSLIFGAIVFLILNKKWKVLSYSFIAAVVLTGIIYFTPSLNETADKIIKKDFPEFYSSRMWMWEPSYKAALEGGLIGLGYGISHPEIRSGEYSDRFEDGRLIREKGNSSLALVEEAGLIGLILFLIPIFYILFRVIPGKVSLLTTHYSILTTNYSLLTAALAAFLLHSQFEAWWIGVGSVQLPLFFVYIGLLIEFQQIKSQ